MADLSRRKRRQRARLLEALGFRKNGHGYGWPDEGYEPPEDLPALNEAMRERVLQEYIPSWHALNHMAAHLTPPEIARALVEKVAHLIPGARVLEPCAGIGHLVEEIKRHGPGELVAWEWDAEMAAILAMLHPDVTCAEANMWTAWQDHEAAFDLIVANPPFGDTCGRGTGEGLDFNGKVAEFLSIEAIVRMLRPGGTAALILPCTAFDNGRWGPMTRWLQERGVAVSSFGLPCVDFAFTKVRVKGVLLQSGGGDGGSPCEAESAAEEPPDLRALVQKLQRDGRAMMAHLQRLQRMVAEGTAQPSLFKPEGLPGPVQLPLFGEEMRDG